MASDVSYKANSNNTSLLGAAVTGPYPVAGSGIDTRLAQSFNGDPGTVSLYNYRFDEVLHNLAGSGDVHSPASNTTATIVHTAAGEGRRHVLGSLSWSYDSVPTSGNLQVKDGTSIILNHDITNAGPGQLQFAKPFRLTYNSDLTATLYKGGPNVTGKLCINERWIE